MTATCLGCGHTRDAHEHYRGGSECSEWIEHTAIDGRPWKNRCTCVRYSPSLLARVRGWLR